MTPKQMGELESLVKRERQRLSEENPHNRELAVAMRGIQTALQRSVYFFNKHMADNGHSFNEEESWINGQA